MIKSNKKSYLLHLCIVLLFAIVMQNTKNININLQFLSDLVIKIRETIAFSSVDEYEEIYKLNDITTQRHIIPKAY